jgi:hypothetical protein
MKIGLIHSTRLVMPWVEEADAPFQPRVSFLHALDEALIVELAKNQGVTEGARRRIAWMARSLIDAGVDRLVLTCSSLSPAVDTIAPELSVPLVKIDTAMIRAAIGARRPFVILATNPSTREPMRIIVEKEYADVACTCANLERPTTAPLWHYELLDDAFAALNRGDAPAHDAAVIDTCEHLARAGTSILFAQISMARVLPRLSPIARAHITTSLDSFATTIGLT